MGVMLSLILTIVWIANKRAAAWVHTSPIPTMQLQCAYTTAPVGSINIDVDQANFSKSFSFVKVLGRPWSSRPSPLLSRSFRISSICAALMSRNVPWLMSVNLTVWPLALARNWQTRSSGVCWSLFPWQSGSWHVLGAASVAL